jgi:hypothetical protein
MTGDEEVILDHTTMIQYDLTDTIRLARTLIRGCAIHPSYRYENMPTTDCEHCKMLYAGNIKFNRLMAGPSKITK